MSDIDFRLHSLHVYPVKSCGGITLDEALLVETGLELDRAWMVVDEHNEFVTQRELPRMALIHPTLRYDDLVLRAPGMLALHLSVSSAELPVRARVWDDWIDAYDMGGLAAQWFSDFLGRSLRLVRFDPEQRRLSSAQWTGSIEAENAFSDGYPLLITSTASLDELNRRLAAEGHAAVTVARMRPNLVLEGLEPHGEDHLDKLHFDTAEGPVRLKMVKPCSRCPIPDIDPLTAKPGHAVGDVLASYRFDARVDGSITFGMNAVLLEGVDRVLRAGMAGSASYRFD